MQTILFAIFPVEKRGTAMGTFGLVISFAPAIGPSLSGWIVDHLPWQVLFYMMLPIALIATVVAYFILRNVTERTLPRLDVLLDHPVHRSASAVCSSASAAPVMPAWTSAEVLVPLAIGAVDPDLVHPPPV